MKKNCQFCVITFEVKQYNKKFCSTKCQQKKWKLDNNKYVLEKQKEYRDVNSNKTKLEARSEEHKMAVKKWKDKNKYKVKKYNAEWCKINRKKSNNYRIACNLRSRFSKALKNNQKSGSAVDDLGCSIPEFRVYLENLFTKDMSWDNYGYGGDKWNIDHIKPLANYDLTNRVVLLELCNYTNLQPLWQLENIAKSNKEK